MIDIIDSINRFFYGVGCVICKENMPFPDLFGRRMEIVNEGMKRAYEESIARKDAEISNLSEKLDEAKRLAETRLARIRRFELSTPNSGEPVPPVVLPKTNGGRIRAMTNREFAAFLADMDANDVWKFGDNSEAWLEWLESDAQ